MLQAKVWSYLVMSSELECVFELEDDTEPGLDAWSADSGARLPGFQFLPSFPFTVLPETSHIPGSPLLHI